MRPTAVPLALLCSLALLAPSAAAQAPKPLEAAAESITEQDVIRHIGVIADDSMMGRDTPSRGLELTAQYVADRFKAFGLAPGGENGTWFQRYPITRRHIDAEHSVVSLASGSETGRAPLASAARYLQGTVPDGPVTGNVLLVGGAIGPDQAAAAVRGRVVLLLMDRAQPSADQVLRAI
ncbi:MAG: hypothetical protein ACM3NS_00675, partial [Deltaproteobacteria bacterium]